MLSRVYEFVVFLLIFNVILNIYFSILHISTFILYVNVTVSFYICHFRFIFALFNHIVISHMYTRACMNTHTYAHIYDSSSSTHKEEWQEPSSGA